MRPIVLYPGTPLYEISKYNANILKPYGKLKEQHTHSSKSFSVFISVTSLCTTIPIDQALLIMRDLLEHDEKLADRTLFSPRQILDLLDILLRTTYLEISTNKQTEQQWEVQLQPSFQESICNQQQPTTADHPPKVWERHVDDVFSIVHKTYLQDLLEHINNLHPQTQFTKEEENNSSLPFLDTLVQ